jgi:HSP20 family protein
VPGVAKEQMKVTIEGRQVNIEAEQNAQTERKEGGRVVYSERSGTRFARRFNVPTEVDQAASQAKREHGVLTLTLPKKVPTGARQITIN